TIPGEEQGGSWAEDGTIIFSAGGPSSLYRVAAAGGAPQRLTRPDPARGEMAHWWPQVLPGGRSVIFTVWSTTLYDARIDWLSLATGERRTLARGGAGGIYAGGWLLWARPTGGVVAAPLDAARGTLTGPPTPLLVDALTHPFYGFMQLAAGGETLVYLPASSQAGERRLLSFDGGAERPLPTPRRFYRNLKAGPGGLLAATIVDRDRSDLWLVDPRSGALTRFTFDGFNIEPAWSADGRWLAYASNRDGAFNIYRRRTDGSAPPERLLRSDHHQHPSSFSPDGRELLVGESDPETGFDLWVLDLASRHRRPLLRTRAQEIYAVWSPDGRWLAYASDESGHWEVVVRSYPDFAGHWQITDGGGFEPFWSADGRTLYFRRGPAIWAVPVAPAGRELHPGAPRKVIERKGLTLAARAPGGGLVAIVDERPRPQPAELRVIVGWPGGLAPPP
ncbi:MAG TPA: hypothetical protein VGV61_16180, partial [Thermoanaerobaculia bacterium]|nr:hypothetical protein [Thermoanaerobaculia bacterium]